MNTKKKEKGVG